MEMDFKILLLFLCITFVSVQGFIPRCCVKTAPVNPRLLKRVEKFSVQNRSLCDIEALVLHVNGKTLCAPLRQKKHLQKINPKQSIV
ncbi:C-C motif chemokine 27b [Silurus meridionalis]|uniref:Chemokine interleukin-8-like domain-containing protein n=1 Tax=Silurus meridionalis TaxID=175797 RepID=A0A8T0B3R3_SILME|nr:C-C motif chemokine 27b [Silurus meridionalis]KAF7701021.1 hypothetical protein HF521_002186 [Silurus meridionalis]